jgi:proline iminopeptidase
MQRFARKALNIFLRLSLAVFVVGLLYASYAYYAYNRVAPQNRPCIDCATPVHVNGYDLYYRELGRDQGFPPVTLVHGGPGHSSLSFKQSFDFLATRSRVIYYDQRGSGNSQIKPLADDYNIEQLVEELECLRREVVKSGQVVLVGHSFGSALVQRYAIKYPNRVAKLVIVGGIPINNSMNSRFVWRWFGPALYSTALGLPPGDPKEADAWMTPTPKDDSDRLFDKTRLDLLEGMGSLSFAPWYRVSLSLAGYDYRSELSQLRIPTLLMYGEADSPYTGKPVADELRETLPNFRSVSFARSGHWPFLEEPERFQKELNGFLFEE